MDQVPKLTEGSLGAIMNGTELKDPIMQVLNSKRVTATTAQGKERFRLLLSDGKHTISYAMLSIQVNSSFGSGQIPDNSVIKLKRYITSVINNTGNSGDSRRVLVILDLEILVSGEKLEKIGNPTVLPESYNTTDESGSAGTKPYSSMKSMPMNAGSTGNPNQSVSLTEQITHPIASLSPYQNKWVIKARVTNKSQIRTWSNSRGEGKLFSMDLIDESGEIRATAFKEMVDKYYDFIEVDKVYYISKCQLKPANKQFSTLKNEYEMTFTNDTVVQECHDTVNSIPTTQYSFIKIDKIAHIETGTAIDVIGVCKSASELATFTSRNSGRELKKREVNLVDDTCHAISLTLWGTDAEKFDGSTNPVIVIKGAKVGEYGGGKNISIFSSSVMKINPDIPECHELRGWFDNDGNQVEIQNISTRTGVGVETPWRSFKDMQDSGVVNAERGEYYQVMGTVMMIKSDNVVYKACPTENCKKKVIDMENGMYRCEKCNREFPNFLYRLLLLVDVGDWSGVQSISMFSAEAEILLGMTAQEVGEAIEANSEAMAEISDKVHFKQFVFKCRAKMETYNDEARLKTVAVKVDPVNYTDFNAHLISRIQQLTT